MTYRYALKYRPPCFATVPKGWKLIERGTRVDAAPLRVDLPLGSTPFGVVEYDRPLTEQEVATYQLDKI